MSEIEKIENDTNKLEAPTNISSDTKPEGKPISKNQLKRIKKYELIVKTRAEKRKQEREKKKLKRLAKKEALTEANIEPVVTRNVLKKNLMANSTNKLRIVVDCSFESYMSENDTSHLCKQLQFCYASNRRLTAPLQFYITDYKSQVKEMLDKMGGSNWDVHRSDQSYLNLFANEHNNICYLTSDSSNVLDKFDENKIYIIGGLVDHNHHKSLCYNLAIQNNIQHCQLPISQYMNMKSRQVLTVNQVFELICKYTECNDWQKAFVDILPKRKGAQKKTNLNDNTEASSNENNEEKKNDV